MSAKFALRSTLVLCVIMLLSALVVGSAVSAQEIGHDNHILASQPEQTIQGGSPVPGGPGFISVSAFAFKPYTSAMNLSYSGAWMFNNLPSNGMYFAPVNLPHGAMLTKVLFFYHDTDPANDMHFYLMRVNMFDGSIEEVARSLPNSSGGNTYVEAAIFQPIVDNQLYSYVLEVGIPGVSGTTLSLINVRIDYDYPVYLPTVQK